MQDQGNGRNSHNRKNHLLDQKNIIKNDGEFKQNSTVRLTALKNIDVGEPDANAEYFISLRAKKDPMYMRGFSEFGGGVYNQLVDATKFILYGQKGTGKTAILRKLQVQLSENYATSFVVFKKEIVEEAQLSDVGVAGYLVDEEKIKSTKLYYHAMKRLILALLLSKCNELDHDESGETWFSSVVANLKESSVGQIASFVTESIVSIVKSANIDLNAASKGMVSVDASLLVKKSNDAFQKYALKQFKNKSLKARIFLDEMHFAYRDSNALSSDAALVRDSLLAAREINEKLVEEGIDALIYVSVRSEFLEHQEIAVADIAHTIESYGVEISWESAPYDRNHPMFDLILKRIEVSLGRNISKDDIFNYYIPVTRIEDFLQYTWGKPRDIVRYFKAAKQSYPEMATIRLGKPFNDVMKRYAQASWQDMKAALASFVPKNSIPLLEEALQELASRNFDNSKDFNLINMTTLLKGAHDDMKLNGVKYDINELIKLLYIIGVIFISYKDARGQTIVHQFHRGNRRPSKNSRYFLHRTIAKALS